MTSDEPTRQVEEDPTRQVDTGPTRQVEEGGDPACWLGQVCPECGRFTERQLPTTCPHCGTEIPAD